MSRLALPIKALSSAEYTPVPPDLTVVKDGEYIRKQIANGSMNEDLTPNFVDHTLANIDSYRSIFGPFFPIRKLCLPGCGPVEYRILVGRMIALRAPEAIGFSERLAIQQSTGIRSVRHVLGLFKKHIELNIVRLSYEESYPKWLFEPNAKRQLRIHVNKQVYDKGGDYEDDDKPVEFKPKNDEMLGPNKKRGIGDLGVYRTNATAHIMSSIKEAWTNDFTYKNTRIRYVKSADKRSLSDAFTLLVNPGENKIFFVLHSDDSCVSADCSDGVVYFNGDIKACDGSHRTIMFNTLFRLLAYSEGIKNVHHDALERAFKYLKQDLVVKYKKDRKQKVKYKFETMRLYSGSTLTTIVNNFANELIAIKLALLVPNPREITGAQFRAFYVQAGEEVGYILKVCDCSCPEQLQFLKHSPSLVDDVWVPWVNLGTFVRGFGTFAGDMPHKSGKYKEAAEDFVSEVVVARANWGNHSFNDSFKHLIKTVTKQRSRTNRVIAEQKEKSIGFMQQRIGIDCLAKRYGCQIVELEQLCDSISRSGVGDIVYHPVVQKIYECDYG